MFAQHTLKTQHRLNSTRKGCPHHLLYAVCIFEQWFNSKLYVSVCEGSRFLTFFWLSVSALGLAKPMGLVEGPGGLGQGGAAATLGEDSRETEGKYEEYGYNAQLSDRISLDRSIPDYRPKKWVSRAPQTPQEFERNSITTKTSLQWLDQNDLPHPKPWTPQRPSSCF